MKRMQESYQRYRQCNTDTENVFRNYQTRTCNTRNAQKLLKMYAQKTKHEKTYIYIYIYIVKNA